MRVINELDAHSFFLLAEFFTWLFGSSLAIFVFVLHCHVLVFISGRSKKNFVVFVLFLSFWSETTSSPCLIKITSSSSRFRRGFKQFFRCCPFVHVGPEVLTRREVVTSRYSCSGSPDHHRIIRNGKSTNEKVSILSEALMSKVSNFLPFLPDTERSFLYACSGSPKSHRKSHGEHHMNKFKHTLPIFPFRLEMFLLRRQKLFIDPLSVFTSVVQKNFTFI